MKPAWFICDKCLFFREDNPPETAGGYCWKNPKGTITDRDSWCFFWTCRRCLEPWRRLNWEYLDSQRKVGWEYYQLIDHNKCQVVG
jgi:hypothetical protein